MTVQWSHSSIKQFNTCARQYHELRVLKNYLKEEGEAQLYGKDLHKAAERYVLHREPIPPQFNFLQPIIDALMLKQGAVYAECEMALTQDLMPCDWKDPGVWVRGIVDWLLLDEDGVTAWCVDYKTGNAKYADKTQLDLMSLLIFAYKPAVQVVNSALVFVVKDVFVKHKVKREDADKLWWEYRTQVAKIEKAHANGVWNPTHSGLCKRHCQVLSCEFNGRN